MSDEWSNLVRGLTTKPRKRSRTVYGTPFAISQELLGRVSKLQTVIDNARKKQDEARQKQYAELEKLYNTRTSHTGQFMRAMVERGIPIEIVFDIVLDGAQH